MLTEAQTLRPLGLGQLLDRAIRLYRRHFLTFTGIVALMLVPITLFQLVATLINLPNALAANEALQNSTGSDPAEVFQAFNAMSGGFITIITSILQTVLVQGLAIAALSRAAATTYLNDEIDIFTAYGKSASQWPRVLLGMFLFYILTVVLSILSLVVICIGWIFGFGIVIYASTVINNLYIPIMVIEEKGPMAALRRAWDLTRRRFWWVLVFMMVLWLLSVAAIYGPAFLVAFISQTVLDSALPTADFATQSSIQTVIQTLFTLFLSLIAYPLQIAATIVLYFDLRIRTEGFDLTYMAAKTESETPPNADEIMQQAPPPDKTDIVTGNELLYFGGVTVGSFALFGAIYAIFVGAIMALALAGS